MILREPKAIGHARSVEIAETAAVVVVVGAVETSVRVLRIVRRPGNVRSETNLVPRRQRPLREAIPVIGRVAREVVIVPAVIVVHEKIGRAMSVVRNGMTVAVTNRGRPRPPANQLRQPYPRPAVSMISALEFLKSNHEPLCRRPTNPTRFPLVGLVRNPSRKVPEPQMQFCERTPDQRIGRLRMNSFGLMKIPMCDRHPSVAWSRLRSFRRPKPRVSPMR
ncbi:hypothetical protein LBMAG52_24850 [Planctomycetia bacterium]|nr:hypothetical protein LBMAG52_24850 [Planctomycetia bacterium]